MNHKHSNGVRIDDKEWIQEHLTILFQYRWLIISIFASIFLLVVYTTLTTQPVYEASATILIKEEQQAMSEMFGGSIIPDRKALNNQIEFLKSRTLTENVIKKLQHSNQASSLYILGNGEKSGGNIFTALRKLPGKVASLLSPSGDSDRIMSREERIRKLAENLKKSIRVEPVEETDVIQITAQAPQRDEAVLIANTMADEYHRQNLAISRGEVNQVKRFLKDQLDTVEDNLFEAETTLKDYQQEADVAVLDESSQQLVEQAAEFESQYNNTLAEINSMETRIEYLESQLSDQGKKIVDDVSETSAPFVKALRDSLASKQVRLAFMEADPSIPADHPIISKLKGRVRELEEQVQKETEKLVSKGQQIADPISYSQELISSILTLQSQVVSQKSKEKFLEGLVNEFERKIQGLPEKSLELARLQRSQQVNEKLYLMMKTKYEETRITEAGQIGNVQIIDRAIPPDAPVKPKKKRNLLVGFLLAVGWAIGSAYALDYVDTSVKSAEDVEEMDFRVMGVIPTIQSMSDNGTPEEKTEPDTEKTTAVSIEQRLITHFEPKNPVSESYRALRTNIQFQWTDTPVKTILVTSAGPGEGKSTTAANLAITMAQMGNRVLLIDGDLRKPMLHEIFHQERANGLTDILVGDDSWNDLIKSTGIEDMDLITTGTIPPNPAELLGSKQMQTLLSEVSEGYNRIIVDSPPILAVTDAAILSTEVTDTLLVVQAGSTNRKILDRARQQITDVGGHVSGVVLNNMKREYMYGSYYSYYYYQYGEKKPKRSLLNWGS